MRICPQLGADSVEQIYGPTREQAGLPEIYGPFPADVGLDPVIYGPTQDPRSSVSPNWGLKIFGNAPPPTTGVRTFSPGGGLGLSPMMLGLAALAAFLLLRRRR